ncbi:hypothetical protein DDV21_010900 [Streptococcus chenjunshii]|uniref:DUF443 family protein n=1 Tax=Streptococcus chenjunshii TaxID=2173853 RepID=A0A372KJ33_9STRE|nr:hypothetical protein [Streptococcus chenjunshii]AXQ79532.1 hypothetical protein DDV21_010900 [Streptococcus chenjunshii]RFU50108.1 hypothetical protein DDV22_10405 [Streptococcus chenjunshii]RFU52260.1 hypothetical protein DDV23_10630 [Streptococcus chenjunshii]
MKYSKQMIAIGNLNKKALFYDKATGEWYTSTDEQKVSTTLTVFLTLVSLPLVRWLDADFIVEDFGARLFLLFAGIAASAAFAGHYARKSYLRLHLQEIFLTEEELEPFLQKEEKNVRTAFLTIGILTAVILLCGYGYLRTSYFLFLFVTVVLTFPLVLFLCSRLWERRQIIKQLVQTI